MIDFICQTCTHVRAEHKKIKGNTYNFYFACALCHKDGWGGSRGIHPAHPFKADTLKYLEELSKNG